MLPRSPYDTSATPEEIAREVANTGQSVEEVAKAFGVEVPEPAPEPPAPRSPYDAASPKPEEVAREAENTGRPIEEIAKELGAPVPAVPATSSTPRKGRRKKAARKAPAKKPGPNAAQKADAEPKVFVPAATQSTEEQATNPQVAEEQK